MKFSYILQYIWKDLWTRNNRPFTLINLIAITIATAILVLLCGAFLAFKKHGNQIIDKQGLSIEIRSKEGFVISKKLQKKLKNLSGLSAINFWTPFNFLLYDKNGAPFDKGSGRTIDLNDHILKGIKDITTGQFIKIKSSKELNSSYDELGIIVPFLLLKQLEYLPSNANYKKTNSWKKSSLPKFLKIYVKEKNSNTPGLHVKLPIIAIAPKIEGARYLMTKDCYKIFNNWKNEYRKFLCDRYREPIFPKYFRKNRANKFQLKKLENLKEDHATIYPKGRENITPLLNNIRSLGLQADCAIEYYLKDYKQQEIFFIGATGGICLIMFFFTGVILLATFQTLILRKLKEIGILKACGASKFLIYKIFSLETIFISCMATSLGLIAGGGCGFYASNLIQQQLQLSNAQWFILPEILVISIFGIATIFCLIITFFPIRIAIMLDPDLVIRN